MKSRKPVELGERINKRWLGYAAAGAAGVGMLATVQPAQADIIYTSSNTPLGTATIDFGSGLADFEFSNASHFDGGFFRAYRIGHRVSFGWESSRQGCRHRFEREIRQCSPIPIWSGYAYVPL